MNGRIDLLAGQNCPSPTTALHMMINHGPAPRDVFRDTCAFLLEGHGKVTGDEGFILLTHRPVADGRCCWSRSKTASPSNAKANPRSGYGWTTTGTTNPCAPSPCWKISTTKCGLQNWPTISQATNTWTGLMDGGLIMWPEASNRGYFSPAPIVSN